MDKLKPCPTCGKLDLYAAGTKKYLWFAFVISCFNSCCTDCSVIAKFGFTKAQAKRRAIKAWNRRCGMNKSDNSESMTRALSYVLAIIEQIRRQHDG